MEHKPVNSSNIESMAHDPVAQVLEVKFKGGNTYRYKGVSADAHDSLMNAESIGKHFHSNIKSVCDAEKVEG